MTVSEKLRLVQGLHSHAEMFGFNWNDDSDWTWHDVACKIADEIDDENAKLRELVVALYHIHFGTEEESWDAWEDFCPCGICEERHGGEAPCAYTAKDLADECCEPITKEIVIDRMRELGLEVDG